MAALSKVREELAQTFLDVLNQGQLPWRKCWSQALPVNAVTGKTYRGINTLVLSYYGDRRGYTDTRWCTYNQAQEKGWQVRKDSKGVKVEYWACYDTKEKKLLSWDDVRQKLKLDPDYEKHLQLRCRTYTVFNGEQIDGIPAPEQRPSTDIGALRAKRDTLIQNMGIGYQERGIRAYYSPGMDSITLPPEATFDDTYSYMATFLHECGHASGHEARLNRDLTGGFGSESYAREELRAEIASAFTAQSLGLQLTDEQLQYQTEQHTAYIQGWSKILQDSPEELFRAIKDAEAISNYLIEKGEFIMEQTNPQHPYEKSFINAFLDGEVLANDIDAYIEYWHTHEVNCELYDFLGMTKNEYAHWLKSGDDSILHDILNARNDGIAFEVYQTMSANKRIADVQLSTQDVALKEWCIVYKSPDWEGGELEIVPAEELQGREVIETFYCVGEQEALEKLERYEELQRYFWDESNDPETQEWREELTADEASMVERWDLQTAKGFSRLATDILERSAAQEQIMVAIESTDDYADASFHSELIDLDKQNRDDSWGTEVDHYRLVKIGDSGRIEALDKDLVFDTRAQAEAVATSIPYARLVDYDTLVHGAGKNLTVKYTLEELSPGSSDLRLRFHGYGKIEGYSFPEARPWQTQINRIREVVIEKGITEIGRNVLNDYPALEKLTRPKSLQQTDPHILRNCPMLKEIKYTGDRSAPSVTSPHELMELAEKYSGFKVEQLQEISAGIHDGLTAEQIAYYARPGFGSVQMNALRYCVTSGLTPEQLAVIANPAFGAVQMDVIRSSFQSGMTMEQVSTIARPELTPNQMLDRYREIRNTPAVQHRPDDPLFQAEREFWEMDNFLKRGGDIAELADWYEKDLSPDWD